MEPVEKDPAEDNHVAGAATTIAQNAIVGDDGLQPLSSLAQSDANRVGPSSAPDPSTQSGIPLQEDRDKGVVAAA